MDIVWWCRTAFMESGALFDGLRRTGYSLYVFTRSEDNPRRINAYIFSTELLSFVVQGVMTGKDERNAS